MLKVYLKDDGRRADARAQLVGLQKLGKNGARRFAAGDLDFLTVQYDWDELRAWYEVILHLGLDQIHEYDIDDKRNRIRLVVEHPGEIRQVEDASAAAGVPTSALIIEAEARVSLAAGPVPSATSMTPTDLEDNDSPIRAGFFIVTNEGTCTMTANTEYDSNEGFLTAAHCTSLWGDVTPADTAWHGSQGKIADEDIDPPFVGSSTYASCPTSSHVCRYSDAAMFEYDGAGTGDFGIIARAKWGDIELETPDLSIEDDDPACPWVIWCRGCPVSC